MRFVVDAMLGTLAKWLRILGYDTSYDPGLDDHQLARLARAEARVLITRDRELAHRRGIQVLFISSENLEDQVAQVLAELDLTPDQSYSRCPRCNVLLEKLDHKVAKARVPPYVARTHKRFKLCPACRQVYWRGTHWRQMEQQMARFRALRPGTAREGESRENPHTGG
jgi:uncharacterized protein with PIN domain